MSEARQLLDFILAMAQQQGGAAWAQLEDLVGRQLETVFLYEGAPNGEVKIPLTPLADDGVSHRWSKPIAPRVTVTVLEDGIGAMRYVVGWTDEAAVIWESTA